MSELHNAQSYCQTSETIYAFARRHKLDAYQFDMIRHVTRAYKQHDNDYIDFSKTMSIVDIYEAETNKLAKLVNKLTSRYRFTGMPIVHFAKAHKLTKLQTYLIVHICLRNYALVKALLDVIIKWDGDIDKYPYYQNLQSLIATPLDLESL